jgi:DnaJ-class molecular chaperone
MGIRLIECPCCEGEGGWHEGCEDYGHYVECDECKGTGGILGEVEPITLDDMEEVFGTS